MAYQKTTNWTREELESAVKVYFEMQRKSKLNIRYKKTDYYRALSEKYGRSVKSIEYRMQNISHVLLLLGKEWLTGLVPAKNVGSNVESIIREIISNLLN